MEAIRGRSRWLRKAPLELTHSSRPLLDGQARLLLFAAGSAAKEQWHIALSVACAPDGGPGAAIEALYEAFCERARAVASVPYPQVCSSTPKGLLCLPEQATLQSQPQRQVLDVLW